MPKVHTYHEDFNGVRKTLLSYKVGTTVLSRTLGVSLPTARRKLRNPEYFTLGELKTIVKKTSVPAKELERAIWTT